MGISNTNGVNNAQHAQRIHENRELEAMRDKDQIAAGVLSNPNTVSHYEGSIKVTNTGQQTFPIGAPAAGTANTLATYDTNELSALLAGTQAEVSETQNQSAQEAVKADAEQVKADRDKKIEDLKTELSNAQHDKDNKCAVAKIVIGVLLGPIGIPLMVEGITDKNSISKSAALTAEKRDLVLDNYYGEAGATELDEFSEEYQFDEFIGHGNSDEKAKHLGKLDDLKDRGIISPELHADLYDMVQNDEKSKAVTGRILHDAAAAYVDQNAVDEEKSSEQSSVSKTSTTTSQAADRAAENNDEFMKFLAQQAQMAEEQEEALRKVQEDLESSVSTIISGQQNSQFQSGQKTSFI